MHQVSSVIIYFFLPEGCLCYLTPPHHNVLINQLKKFFYRLTAKSHLFDLECFSYRYIFKNVDLKKYLSV